MKRLVTQLRVSWWLSVAQVCMWLALPNAVVAALDLAARSMPGEVTHLVDGWHYHGTEACYRAHCGYEFLAKTANLVNAKDGPVCNDCDREAQRLHREFVG